MQELKGRVAVVTGGGSGIGAALARAFALRGMDVVVADIEAAGDRLQMGTGEARDPDEMQPPEAIAAAVLEGIQANDAYIFTHAHYRRRVEARCVNLMRAFDRADARR